MKSDPRDPSSNGARLIKNCDPITHPYSVELNRSSEDGNDTPTTEISNFLEINGDLYGLGINGSGLTQVSKKTTFNDAVWANSGAANSGNKAPVDKNLFVAYVYGGSTYIYGTQGSGAGGEIWEYNISGAGWTNTDVAINFASGRVSNGVVHSQDDKLYVGYENKVIRNNAGTWTDPVLTLPANYYITSLFEYGNLLGIACAPISGKQVSRIFFWDRDSTLATLSDSIDFGDGNLLIAEEYEGYAVGLVVQGNRLLVKRATTQGAEEGSTIEFVFDSAPTLYKKKQKRNDRIYFLMQATLDGTTHYGVWAIGKNKLGEWYLYLDRTPNNNTDPLSNGLTSFLLIQNSSVEYMFIAYVDTSSDEHVSKTNDSALHTATGVLETTIQRGEPMLKKQLEGGAFAHAPLPSNATVTLKYLTDEDSSFTTFFSNTTEDSLSKDQANVNAAGDHLPEYKEIKYRLEFSRSGGIDDPIKITGLETQSDIRSSLSYGK